MIELKIVYATKGIVINSINPQNSLKIDAKKHEHSIVVINVMRFSCLEKKNNGMIVCFMLSID